MNNSIYVIDIETDNIDKHEGSIVEIACVRLDLRLKEMIKQYSFVVKERDFIDSDAWIFKNSSLNYFEVINGINLNFLFDVIQDCFFWGNFTCYNHLFDFSWLESRNFKIPNKFPDPMLILTPIMKLKHDYYGNKFPSVVESYYFLFEKKIVEEHRALSDAMVEAEIILEMNNRGYFNEVSTF